MARSIQRERTGGKKKQRRATADTSAPYSKAGAQVAAMQERLARAQTKLARRATRLMKVTSRAATVYTTASERVAALRAELAQAEARLAEQAAQLAQAAAQDALSEPTMPAATSDSLLRADGNAGTEVVTPETQAVAAKPANGSRPTRTSRRR